jgi:hypothetical protein
LDFRFTEFYEVQHSPVPLPGALGTGRGVFSPKHRDQFVERTSMIVHIYLSVLQAGSGRGYAECLDGCFQGYWGGAMHYLGYELPRIPIPRTSVNSPQPTPRSGRYSQRPEVVLKVQVPVKLIMRRRKLNMQFFGRPRRRSRPGDRSGNQRNYYLVVGNTLLSHSRHRLCRCDPAAHDRRNSLPGS